MWLRKGLFFFFVTLMCKKKVWWTNNFVFFKYRKYIYIKKAKRNFFTVFFCSGHYSFWWFQMVQVVRIYWNMLFSLVVYTIWWCYMFVFVYISMVWQSVMVHKKTWNRRMVGLDIFMCPIVFIFISLVVFSNILLTIHKCMMDLI